jgi:Phosphoglucose isomerase/Integrase core domain
MQATEERAESRTVIGSPAWKALESQYKKVRKLHLRELFADDPTQGERLTASAAGIELDYSKDRIADETLALLFLLAKDAGLRERIDAMFSGSKINITENRAVLHTNATSVSQYMVRRRRPPSQTWKTFLENHVKSMVSVDFLAVPTIRLQILYVLLALAYQRRRVVHFAVTAHPTAEWTSQQLRETFPWDTAPRYRLRERDRIFGKDFDDQAMGIQQVLSAPRSPWQRAYVERVIGTIRRECLDHMIVFGEGSLYRHLQNFINYYHRSRTHLALAKDSPEPRPVQPPGTGRIIAIPEVGGLHHRYQRRAA